MRSQFKFGGLGEIKKKSSGIMDGDGGKKFNYANVEIAFDDFRRIFRGLKPDFFSSLPDEGMIVEVRGHIEINGKNLEEYVLEEVRPVPQEGDGKRK